MSVRLTLPILALCGAITSAGVRASDADAWRVTAGVYGYLPTISGTSVFAVPPDTSGSEASVDIDQLLANLNGIFMGSLDVGRGEWGGFTDLIYMDIGNTKSGTRSVMLGGQLPADASANADYSLKGTVWTLAAYYHQKFSPELNADLLLGARMLDLDQSLGWALSGNLAGVPIADRSGHRDTGTPASRVGTSSSASRAAMPLAKAQSGSSPTTSTSGRVMPTSHGRR